MTTVGLIDIELACAWPDRQWIETLQVPAGTTLAQALALSQRLPEAGGLPVGADVGIWSDVVADPETRVLQSGDRIEIYRPLRADPKEARRDRVRAARQRQGR